MLKSIMLFILLLFCGISCVSTHIEKGAPTWEQAMQTARSKAEANEYDDIIENLLAPECVAKASAEHASAEGWQARYIDKHLKHLPYYFNWLLKREVQDKGNEVILTGEHGCFAHFLQVDGRWYLLDFGQHITSM